jgi:hypothetical protein
MIRPVDVSFKDLHLHTVQNRRLLRFARNDNVNKIRTLVSLRGVPRRAGRRGNLDFKLVQYQQVKFQLGQE